MSDQQLHKTLEKLQDELTNAQPKDIVADAAIEDVQRDLQKVLEQSAGEPTEQHQSLLARLRNAIPYFESTHPRLTTAMNEVVDELNRMGL